MNTKKAKIEIINLLDQMSEQNIITVLEYARDLIRLAEIDEEAARYLTEIMKEDNNLLKRLAE